MDNWKHWHYKNTTLLLLSLLFFFAFSKHEFFQNTISYIGNLGYIGAFISGFLFVSVFTIIPASVILFLIAEALNPFLVAIFAGTGGVLGDYLIFRFLKDKVFEELKPLYLQNGGNKLKKLFKTPYFAWLIPILGAFIIASPFPDEVGIGLLGVSKLKKWQFLLLTFALNSIGILIIITAANSL